MIRNRLLYLPLCGVVILLGLASRRFGQALPEFVASYAGDTLWALMIFLGVGFLFARWPTWKVLVTTLLICYAVEISQLYHAPWIDKIRDTRLGGLVLGYVFLWSDLVCYTVGALFGALAERIFLKR